METKFLKANKALDEMTLALASLQKKDFKEWDEEYYGSVLYEQIITTRSRLNNGTCRDKVFAFKCLRKDIKELVITIKKREQMLALLTPIKNYIVDRAEAKIHEIEIALENIEEAL